MKMTIDEAIKHCLEVAEENEELSSKFDEWDEWEEADANNCRECAADHRQLAEWLTELKELEAKHWDECRQIAHYDDEVKRLKAADQPVKHGRWFHINNGGIIYCSECENEAYWDTDYGQQLFDYCPYCGARMIKDGDKE
jgi:hypothetical protein